jgi:hypothetical protein
LGDNSFASSIQVKQAARSAAIANPKMPTELVCSAAVAFFRSSAKIAAMGQSALNERQDTFPSTRLWIIRRFRRTRSLPAAIFALLLAVLPAPVSAQPSAEAPDTIHGTVVNSVTREPIPRALVVSPDNRFATMTDSQGRFEFTFPKAEPPKPAPEGLSEGNPAEGLQPNGSNRPGALSARKPGFLDIPANLAQNAKELTLSLVPEAIIAGQVSLPTSEPPDSIQLQLYRRQVQDGRAHWTPAGTAASRSNGEFRFAELHSGTYKLLTRELLDRDPLTFDRSGQLYGYPPVYYQDAADFDSATTIELSAGETAQADIALVKQAYYNAKIAVENVPPGVGLNLNVYRQGHNGPGYALGYNAGTQTIDGMLPNGTYTVEATSFGQTTSTGLMILNIKGAAVERARLTLAPGASIPINVKEEFTSKEPEGTTTFNNGKRTFNLRGPRRYLNVNLELADKFGAGTNGFLRPPKGPEDEALVIENVLPGRYWVRVQSSRGYAASVRSGTTDLLHEPLTVGAGGATSPIEITVRDDTAAIDGNVEGIIPPPIPSSAPLGELETGAPAAPAGPPPAYIYCIPLPETGGEVTQIAVAPDGSFASQPLPPGTYRLLAFDREQHQLEYRDPEAMKTYDHMGPAVQVAGGQKEHVTLQLILGSE